MVGEWAYVKELATVNRGRGEWSLLGRTQRGNVVRNREKGVSIGKKVGENYDQYSSFLTESGNRCGIMKRGVIKLEQ